MICNTRPQSVRLCVPSIVALVGWLMSIWTVEHKQRRLHLALLQAVLAKPGAQRQHLQRPEIATRVVDDELLRRESRSPCSVAKNFTYQIE
jgi:hypothetical protein